MHERLDRTRFEPDVLLEGRLPWSFDTKQRWEGAVACKRCFRQYLGECGPHHVWRVHRERRRGKPEPEQLIRGSDCCRYGISYQLRPSSPCHRPRSTRINPLTLFPAPPLFISYSFPQFHPCLCFQPRKPCCPLPRPSNLRLLWSLHPPRYGQLVLSTSLCYYPAACLLFHVSLASKEWVIPAKPKPGRKPKKDIAPASGDEVSTTCGSHATYIIHPIPR